MGLHAAEDVIKNSDGGDNVRPLAIVQDPWSAEHPEMPRAAIETGYADCVSQLEEFAAQIQKSVRELKYKNEQETGLLPIA